MNENLKEYNNLAGQILLKIGELKNTVFGPEDCMLQEDTVSSMEEYNELFERYKDKYEIFDRMLNDIALELNTGNFYYKAYCAVCEKDVIMIFHGLQENDFRQKGGLPGFREEFFCPTCGCQGRIRYIISKLKKEYKRGMKVYMYEYNAPGFKSASKFVSPDDLIGSEYFGSNYKSGEYVNGILHEDAANLSFDDESIDLMVSMDVFEHIYFYEKAFREVYQVLKPGGKLLLTIPMAVNREHTMDRAKIVNGQTIHLAEPIFHGGGTNTEYGLLEYTTFGWDILPQIKNIGFKNVKIRTYYSINDAYMGVLNYYFEIVK